MSDRVIPKPLEDDLLMTVYGPDREVLWHGQVRTVPRVGEDILLRSIERKGWSRGGTVERVVWLLREKLAGQRVAVWLDIVVTNKDPA